MDIEEDSSESGSDFEEVEADDETITKLYDLETDLSANPNLYETHVEYIKLLRSSKMKTKLKAGRAAMHSRFPFTEALWLEWLEDDAADLKSTSDLRELEKLFQKATEDYLSIPIWLKYIEVLQEHDEAVKAGAPDGKQRMRAVYENALTAGGLHVSQGCQLWHAARKYEEQHCSQPSPKPDCPIAKLLLRQLQVPLRDGGEALRAWAALCGCEAQDAAAIQQTLPASVGAGYASAQKAVDTRTSYEELVAPGKPADESLLAAYVAYIKLEEGTGEPARVQIIYERALAQFPVTHVLWLQYAAYLEQHLHVLPVVRLVYARAVRNCPWIGTLWARGLRALERAGAAEAEHAAVFDASLAAGMEDPEDYTQVLLARLDALRRQGQGAIEQLRAAFEAATELMQTYFPDHVDRSLRIPAYWATCELELANNYEGGRKVWEAALQSSLGTYAEAIAAYVAFEVSAKHVKEARSIFRKYHRRRLAESGGAAVCEAWLRFEREHGSADDYFQATVKAEPVLAEAAAAAVEIAQPELAAETQALAEKTPRLSKADLKRMRQEKDPNFKKADKPADKKRKQGLGFQPKGEVKRAKADEGGAEGTPALQSSGATDVNMVDAPQADLAASAQPSGDRGGGGGREGQMMPPPAQPPQDRQQQPAGPPAEGAAQAAVVQVSDHQRTAYVKGISPEATRQEVEAVLAPCGNIVEFTLPEDRSSDPPKLRGFGYVTFASADGLRSALALTGTALRGSALVIYVSHKAVRADERTAFVLNVAPGTTVEGLEALLGMCGPIKSVRIPLNWEDSRPRGFAYVEFESSEGLQKAVDMTGIELDGRNLRIAVSGPSAQGRQGSRGRGRDGPGSRGRGPRGGHSDQGPGNSRGGRSHSGRGREDGQGRGRGDGQGRSSSGLENGGRSNFQEYQVRGRGFGGRHRLQDGVAQEGVAQGRPGLFVPRAIRPPGRGSGGGGDGAPKSNADFRAMLKK